MKEGRWTRTRKKNNHSLLVVTLMSSSGPMISIQYAIEEEKKREKNGMTIGEKH